MCISISGWVTYFQCLDWLPLLFFPPVALMEVDNSPQNDPAPPPSLAADGQPSSSRTMAGRESLRRVNYVASTSNCMMNLVSITESTEMAIKAVHLKGLLEVMIARIPLEF